MLLLRIVGDAIRKEIMRRLDNQQEDPDILFGQLREAEGEIALFAAFVYGGGDSGLFIREKARFFSCIATADDGPITFYGATEDDMFRQ